jgi:hypothetical protein
MDNTIKCKVMNKLNINDNKYHLISNGYIIKAFNSIKDLNNYIDNVNNDNDYKRQLKIMEWDIMPLNKD